LEVVHPGVKFDEGFAADVVEASSAVVFVGTGFDQPGLAEVAEVLADGRLAALDAAGEFGDCAWLVGEFPDDRLPDRVCEQVESAHGWRRQRVAVARMHAVFGMHLFARA